MAFKTGKQELTIFDDHPNSTQKHILFHFQSISHKDEAIVSMDGNENI